MKMIPRESLELLGPILITATSTDNEPVDLSSLSVTVKRERIRPTSGWESPVMVDGERYLLVGPPDRPLAPGRWIVWGRLTDLPEVPVFQVGTFNVT